MRRCHVPSGLLAIMKLLGESFNLLKSKVGIALNASRVLYKFRNVLENYRKRYATLKRNKREIYFSTNARILFIDKFYVTLKKENLFTYVTFGGKLHHTKMRKLRNFYSDKQNIFLL